MKYITSLLLFLNTGLAFSYEMKVVLTDSYSKPWIAIYDSPATLLKTGLHGRIHFHGFTQDPKTGLPFSNFDFPWVDETKMPSEDQLRHFVDGYGFQREVLYYPNHVVLIPISRGHCDQYSELFDVQKFDATLNQVLQKLGIKDAQFTLTMASAHSGGGEVLSRLLEQVGTARFFSKVVRTDFYDGLYSNDATKRVQTWISSSGPRELRLFSIPSQEPARHGASLFGAVPGKEKLKMTKVKEFSVQERVKDFSSGSRIELIQETEQKLNHWTLLKALWII